RRRRGPGLAIVVDLRVLLIDGLLRDVAAAQQLLVAGEVQLVVRERLVRLRERGAGSWLLIATYCTGAIPPEIVDVARTVATFAATVGIGLAAGPGRARLLPPPRA